MRVPLNHWYPVLEPREVRRKPVTAERLGQRLVFWRSSDGVLHAQRDCCPHLGASLGTGRVVGNALVGASGGLADQSVQPLHPEPILCRCDYPNPGRQQ